MNKIQFDNLLKPLVELYDEIELELIKNILIRLENYSNVQGTLEWYLEKLEESKLLEKTNIKTFKSNKKKIQKILSEIANNSGNHIDNLEQLKKYYKQGLLEVNPSVLYNSKAVENLINEAIKDSENITELINTKALESVNKNYKKILNKAYLETTRGIYTYTESIRRALNEFAETGIQTVHYDSGKSLSIEAAVRRDIITRMNKLVGDCELEHAKELKTNLVYVDQHLGARTRTKYTKHDYEVHAEWQGKKYMIDGSSDKYENLIEATGYGEMLGLKGINCYHNMRPTWEWEEIPERIDEVENAIEYERLKKKTEYSRKIRNIKRKLLVAKQTNNQEDLMKANKSFAIVNKNYDDWLTENGMTRDYNREFVSYIGKRKNYQDITKKWLSDANPNSHKVKDLNIYEYDGIKYKVDKKNVVLDYSSKEKEVAEWLENKLGGELYMVPRINNPEGISTPDYLYKNEYWDLKEILGNGKRTIDTAIKKKQKQSHNFIIDISKSKMTNDQAISQLHNILDKKDRLWVDKLLLKRDDDLIIILKHKKRD